MPNTEEKIYQIALSQVKGIGYALSQKLMTHFGSAHNIFHSSSKELVKVLGKNQQVVQKILSKVTIPQAIEHLALHSQAKVRIITPWEDAYPERLRHIHGTPNLLYLRGNADFRTTKVISIVGTRRATSYGKKVIETLLSELSTYPLLIVSGLAYGVDIHAHKTALALGLPTLAVVAGCIENIYPSAHNQVAEEMLSNGGILSEHPLHTLPEPYQFAMRNRIIAGLADATIVVEAGEKSGALITARWANEYSREVFAVSGGIYDPYSTGCHYLIKTHQASLLTSAADIVEALNWDITASAKTNSPNKTRKFTNLTEIEKGAVSTMGQLQKEVHIDELSQQAKIPMDQMAAIILSLEMKRIVQIMPGRKLRLATSYA